MKMHFKFFSFSEICTGITVDKWNYFKVLSILHKVYAYQIIIVNIGKNVPEFDVSTKYFIVVARLSKIP